MEWEQSITTANNYKKDSYLSGNKQSGNYIPQEQTNGKPNSYKKFIYNIQMNSFPDIC